MASASNASGSPTGDLRAERGDAAGSNAACRQPVRFAARDALLVKAGGALFAGKLGIAEGLCRQCLKKNPTNVSAIRMLADVAIRIGRHHDAEKLLARCLELAPDFHLARNNYAHLLFKTFRYREALAEIDKVIAAEPNRASHRLLKASILARIGEAEGAIDIYKRVLERYPDQPRTRMSMGHALKTLGRQADAIAAYQSAAKLAPGFGEAYWSLANLKTFQFDDAQIAAMRQEIDQGPESIDDRYHLSFALGKALPVASAASSRAPTHRSIHRFWAEWLPTNWRNSAPSTSVAPRFIVLQRRISSTRCRTTLRISGLFI